MDAKVTDVQDTLVQPSEHYKKPHTLCNSIPQSIVDTTASQPFCLANETFWSACCPGWLHDNLHMRSLCLAGHEEHLTRLSPTHLQQSMMPGSSVKLPLCTAYEGIYCQLNDPDCNKLQSAGQHAQAVSATYHSDACPEHQN